MTLVLVVVGLGEKRSTGPYDARGDLVVREGAERGARRAEAGVSAWGYP
jgi:hypothetical protein